LSSHRDYYVKILRKKIRAAIFYHNNLSIKPMLRGLFKRSRRNRKTWVQFSHRFESMLASRLIFRLRVSVGSSG